MTYQEQFFAGVELIGMLEREYYTSERMAGMRKYLLDATSAKRAPEYQEFVPGLPKIARQFVRPHDPVRELGRRCHIYSDQFNRAFRAHIGDGAAWFFLTIGEVKFRRESVYDITEQKVISVFQRGFQPNEELGVHVWLTFEEMTIVDLTIMASLLRLGWIDRSEYDRNPVVVGKAEQLTDFEYQPFLVDNDFAGRVDRFQAIPSKMKKRN